MSHRAEGKRIQGEFFAFCFFHFGTGDTQEHKSEAGSKSHSKTEEMRDEHDFSHWLMVQAEFIKNGGYLNWDCFVVSPR